MTCDQSPPVTLVTGRCDGVEDPQARTDPEHGGGTGQTHTILILGFLCVRAHSLVCEGGPPASFPMASLAVGGHARLGAVGVGHRPRRVSVTCPVTQLCRGSLSAPRAVATSPATVGEADLVSEYNRTMAERMGWATSRAGLSPYEYHPERGLYYHFITPSLLLGSQPRTPADVRHLAEEEGVTCMLSLQQDRDLAHWRVDAGTLRAAASDLGVTMLRAPAVDFDPHSLRATLPNAVALLLQAQAAGRRVYVHCTAGLGRAPAAVIAALFWQGLGVLGPAAGDGLADLDEAYRYVTAIRPCGPSRDAIRGATGDLLLGHHAGCLIARGEGAFVHLNPHDRAAIVGRLNERYPTPA